jgi:ATP-dependent Clp protease protease subunit
MHDFINPKNIDPRMMARAAEYIGKPVNSIDPRVAVPSTRPTVVPPMTHPMNMPAAPGPGGYMRYREMTIDEMLLENRVVFMVGEINHVSASNCIMRLLYLQSVKRDQDINLYINSPGGVVDDTLAIYDIMRFMTCDIATYCIGRAESGGAIVFMAGKKGKRYILPNAKVMIHQPFGGVYGQAADIEIQAEEILKTKDTLVNIMAKCTGQTAERVREDSERDRFFDAKQAVKYGICDEILGEDTSPETAAAAADATKPK